MRTISFGHSVGTGLAGDRAFRNRKIFNEQQEDTNEIPTASSGYATFPGSEYDRKVADACVELLTQVKG